MSLGYSGNLHDIAHGTNLRARIGELEQEQLRLRAQIAQRQHKIEDLQTALQKAQGGELAEVAKRREQLDAQIQEEQEAIKRAEDRLNQLQGAPPAPAPTPPPSTTTPPR
jgi:peptidoglycan hydrolase CwlO-like protein